jgi:tetratricopeptide (TPR) repeat protein
MMFHKQETTMKHLQGTFALFCIFLAASAVADDSSRLQTLNGDAEQCFAEAEKAALGESANDLSTVPCRRALRQEPLSRQDRSATLHNRGVIQQAKGDLEKARSSFAHAVRLSTTVDMRNLALAQAAHKLGEFALAVEQYDVWIAAVADGQPTASLNTVLANREIAAAALGPVDVASRQ